MSDNLFHGLLAPVGSLQDMFNMNTKYETLHADALNQKCAHPAKISGTPGKSDTGGLWYLLKLTHRKPKLTHRKSLIPPPS